VKESEVERLERTRGSSGADPGYDCVVLGSGEGFWIDGVDVW
jgi:hypothetical protein